MKDAESISRRIFAVILLSVFAVACVLVIRSAYSKGKIRDLLAGGEMREKTVNNVMPMKDQALVPDRMFNSILDRWYYPEENYLILPDGQIVSGSAALQDAYAADGVLKLYRFCREEGRDFLHVLLPVKPLRDEDMREYGLLCYRNDSADGFLLKLEEYGIPFLDLRETILAQEDPYALFYRSDHHWTADAGLIAARKIAETLNTLYDIGLDEDAIAPEVMRREVLEEPFVGEMGKKLLGPYGSLDNLVVWKPLHANLHYRVPDRKIDRTGDFDIIFFEERYRNGRLDGMGNTYYYYMGENDSLGSLENLDGGSGDLLVIKDSMSCVVTPYLALTAGKVTWWDMRKDTAVIDYLKKHPEIRTVVVMYNTSYALSRSANDFS